MSDPGGAVQAAREAGGPTAQEDRAESAVSESRVKMHHFGPSGRAVWTVVGRSKEHWIDPDGRYCSCRGFYFGIPEGRKSCYHLDSALLARRLGRVERVSFDDSEFGDFVAGLISDL